jgi:hypothetical protein
MESTSGRKEMRFTPEELLANAQKIKKLGCCSESGQTIIFLIEELETMKQKCIEVVKNEKLIEDTLTEGDIAYNLAITHCAKAIDNMF